MSAAKAMIAGLAVIGLTPLALASVGELEFEDLVLNTNYPNGSSFVTEGITINVINFFFLNGDEYSDGSVQVVIPNGIGAGNGMRMGDANLDFQFPFPLTSIEFSYAIPSGNINLIVNGDLFNTNDIGSANGMVIGGANVSVASGVRGGVVGTVTIQGNLTQFAVGGQEIDIDDVRYVPTPGAISLLALGGVAGLRRRR